LRYFVTGADGYIGRALCKKLAEKKDSVHCGLWNLKYRACLEDSLSIENKNNLHFVETGDISRRGDWTEFLKDIDVVIHLAARAHVLVEREKNPTEIYRSVNVAPAGQIAKDAIKMGVKRLVFMSSAGVYGTETEEGKSFCEDSPAVPVKDYAVFKWNAECLIREIAAGEKLETVILRPPVSYGPFVHGNFLRLLNWSYRGVPLPLGSICNKRSFVGLDNLVDAIILSSEHPDAKDEIFNVSDGDDFSTGDIISIICGALNRPCRVFPFPELPMRVMATMIGRRDDVARLFSSFQVNSDKIKKVLKWIPPVSFRDGIKKMCEWYLSFIVA